MKNRGSIKWVACLALGVVLAIIIDSLVLTSLLDNNVATKFDSLIFIIIYVIYFALFYLLIGKFIRWKMQSTSYGIVATILCSLLLSLGLMELTYYAIDTFFFQLIVGLIYGVMIHVVAAKLDKK